VLKKIPEFGECKAIKSWLIIGKREKENRLEKEIDWIVLTIQ
jgi:hypothetical protein